MLSAVHVNVVTERKLNNKKSFSMLIEAGKEVGGRLAIGIRCLRRMDGGGHTLDHRF